MALARGLALAILASLGVALLPGGDWAFQFVYPLLLGLGAASLRWWPALIVVVLPLWAALDYRLDPYEGEEIDGSFEAGLVALLVSVPVSLGVFAIGKGLRAFALALGARNRPSE